MWGGLHVNLGWGVIKIMEPCSIIIDLGGYAIKLEKFADIC